MQRPSLLCSEPQEAPSSFGLQSPMPSGSPATLPSHPGLPGHKHLAHPCPGAFALALPPHRHTAPSALPECDFLSDTFLSNPASNCSTPSGSSLPLPPPATALTPPAPIPHCGVSCLGHGCAPHHASDHRSSHRSPLHPRLPSKCWDLPHTGIRKASRQLLLTRKEGFRPDEAGVPHCRAQEGSLEEPGVAPARAHDPQEPGQAEDGQALDQGSDPGRLVLGNPEAEVHVAGEDEGAQPPADIWALWGMGSC